MEVLVGAQKPRREFGGWYFFGMGGVRGRGAGWDLSVHLSVLSAQLCKHTQWALEGKERLANKPETWRECTDPQHYFLSLVPHNSIPQSPESQVTPELLKKIVQTSASLFRISLAIFSSHTPFPYSVVIPPSFHFLSLFILIFHHHPSLTGLQQTSLALEDCVSLCLKAITRQSCEVCPWADACV